MQPNAVPPYPWHTVTTDYVTGLFKTANKYDAIAVFVDELTKYVLLVPCSKESSGANWAHMFTDSVMFTLGYLSTYCLIEVHNLLACSTSHWLNA